VRVEDGAEGKGGISQDIWRAVHSHALRDFAPCNLTPEAPDDALESRTVERGVMIGELQPGAGGNGGKAGAGRAGEGKEGKARPVFYGNLKVYTFFRLYQTMYERLCKAKALAAAQDARKLSDARERVVNTSHTSTSSLDAKSASEKARGGGGEEGETDDATMSGTGGSERLEAAAAGSKGLKEEGEEGEGGGEGKASGGGGKGGSAERASTSNLSTNTYETFMTMVSKLLAGRMDSADFEENCRVLLGVCVCVCVRARARACLNVYTYNTHTCIYI
jgi:histone deacetylase complex regulatory component SIN3